MEKEKKEFVGLDIGGTKCAVVRGAGDRIDQKIRFETTNREETLSGLFKAVEELITPKTSAIGVSCGGPLDSKRGIIQSPPNLPGWDNIPITDMLTERFRCPAYLCNDADACALAEWRYGAGVGTENMIFLTFGTGLGAGLILGGRLYSGTCGMAGEIGHVTLYEGKPGQLHIGYGKPGTAEGYCSGGGIAQYGLGSARELGIRADAGDTEACEIYRKVGEDLGKTLAILIDLLNPEAIVIGSIYVRSRNIIEPSMIRAVKERALSQNVAVCKIYPAKLGESLGDAAALCVAEMGGSDYAL